MLLIEARRKPEYFVYLTSIHMCEFVQRKTDSVVLLFAEDFKLN